MKRAVLDASVLVKLFFEEQLYVALAVQTNSAIISGDRRLVNAPSGTPAWGRSQKSR